MVVFRSRILPHVLRRGPDGRARGGQVALMERAHFVRLERADDGMEHAAIVEQDEVLLLPIVRVHQLDFYLLNYNYQRWTHVRSARWRDAAFCTAARAPPSGPSGAPRPGTARPRGVRRRPLEGGRSAVPAPHRGALDNAGRP